MKTLKICSSMTVLVLFRNIFRICAPYARCLPSAIITLSIIFFSVQNCLAQENGISFLRLSSGPTPDWQALASAIQLTPTTIPAEADLSDFDSLAQKGLDFMAPGASIENLIFKSYSVWSSLAEDAMGTYLSSIYENTIIQNGSAWIDSLLSHWQGEGAQFGLLSWEISIDDSSQEIESIAVFDGNWEILFDTELINFITGIHVEETAETGDNQRLQNRLPINYRDTDEKKISFRIEGTIPRKYVIMEWSVKGTAEVTRYVTDATNDAYFRFDTNSISCKRKEETRLSPPGNPLVFFGLDGQPKNLYKNADPFKSPIYFSDSADHFFSGEYKVHANSGKNFDFTFTFSVSDPTSGAGLAITPSDANVTGFTLTEETPSEIFFNNYLFEGINPPEARGSFWDGGILSLYDFNILTETGGGGNEVETVNLFLPIQHGYTTPVGLTGLGTMGYLDLSVEYLRGNAILQPSYRMTASNYAIESGQLDTIKVTIINNSGRVNLQGGSITLDTGTLKDQLNSVSAATLPIVIIEEQTSKDFIFIVEGAQSGTVKPQVEIKSLGWESPVPSLRIINDLVSLDANIVVEKPTAVENDEPIVVTDFKLSQNYPNPFNPETQIVYELPTSSKVTLKILNLMGQEVRTLVNEVKPVGSFKVTWDGKDNYGQRVASGLYVYKLVAGGAFVQTRKMVLLQ